MCANFKHFIEGVILFEMQFIILGRGGSQRYQNVEYCQKEALLENVSQARDSLRL